MIVHPDRYGVWNQPSEGALKVLGLWPESYKNLAFGDRYERINQTLLKLAEGVGVDLWILDALFWRVGGHLDTEQVNAENKPIDSDKSEISMDGSRFGLERHLHEFIRDNWEHTELGRDWMIYEEDGDPEAGYEYPCNIGRIDFLAKHRKETKWMVIELKRDHSNDKTVGQLLRYMGWVKQHMAEESEIVEGLVIAHQANETIQYALSTVQNVNLKLYEVEFHLRDANL
jgi:hypothetical protein